VSARPIARSVGAGTALAALTAVAFAQQSPPADIPGLSLAAAASVVRDGNLFRLPNGLQPRQLGLNTDQRGDTTIVPSASVDANILFGRQRVLLSGTLSRELLKDNPSYDTTDLSYRGSWLWQIGNAWSGELTDLQQQQRTSFADQLLTQANRQTLHDRHAAIDFRPRPDRRIGVVYDQSIGSNSLGIRQINDYRVTFARAELGIDSGLGHELVLGASSTHADYPNQQIIALAPIDNSYRQTQLDLSSLFVLSEKTQLRWRIGYARRRHPEVPQRNFSGLVGNVGVSWEPTAKVQGKISINRDLNDAADYFRIYTITTTATGELDYLPTAKTQIALTASAARIGYKGSPLNFYTIVFGPAGYREDRYDNVRLSLGWTPWDRFSVTLSQALSTRNSSEPQFQFRDWTTELDLQYRIGPW
jgi:hypothetical protein